MIFRVPCSECVRDKYATMFMYGAHTMQPFMWQVDFTYVADKNHGLL